MAIAETPTRQLVRRRSRAPAASRRLADHQIGRLLVLPALIFAILVTQAPFLLTIWYSLQRWNLNRPERRAFVGLDNYVFLLTRDPAFLEAIRQHRRLRRRLRGRVACCSACSTPSWSTTAFPGAASCARC